VANGALYRLLRLQTASQPNLFVDAWGRRSRAAARASRKKRSRGLGLSRRPRIEHFEGHGVLQTPGK
jgi:hypothetical protein